MSVKPKISKIVYEAAAAPPQYKIGILRAYDSPALRIYLGMTIDPTVHWAIPPGPPPYKPNKEENCEMVMYHEAKRMGVFHEGKYPNLKPKRRIELFIKMLEALDPQDAEFLISVVINKSLPEGLTKELIEEAFPDL